MPWSRMYSPVLRCQKNELSESLAMPVANPKTPKNAVNTQPRPLLRGRQVGTALAPSEAVGDPAGTVRSSLGVAVMSERARDVDHRGAEDDHEDRREDAEHQREQHLDRRLLRLLL